MGSHEFSQNIKRYCYGTKKLLSMGIENLWLENMMKENPVQDR